MRCKQCGSENPLATRFCGSCAAPLLKECAACGRESSAEFSFCGHCGARLDSVRSRDGAISDREHLPEPPDAERRQLSVVFCDLVESTAMSERLDPEDLRDLIATYRRICADIVRRCGGKIARYVGDGLLIYFGYPNAHDDDPRMAVRAALEIIKALREFPTQIAGNAGPELQAHIGIHTGLVVAGDLQSGTDREIYSIVGETPNIAARLQDMAEPHSVLISEATYALAKNHFICRDLGLRQFKGISKPQRVYMPVAEREKRSSRELFEFGELTPLEGRAHELALLKKCWERARDGEGQVVLVGGEPGIGKSRLIFALQHAIADEYPLLACSCSLYATDSAFMPLIELIQRQLQINTSDSAADKFAKLETGLARAGLQAADAIAAVAHLLSLPLPADREVPTVAPEIRREKTIETLLFWLLAQAGHRPLLLVVEDIHWADPSTLQLLTLMLRHVPTARLLLILTFRPDYQPTWKTHSYVTHVTLARLSKRECDAMVRNLVKQATLPDELIGQLIDRADGVPLFIEELIKTVVESHSADGYGGDTPRYGDTSIPATLRDSLMARLDRLNSVKLTAQIASTLGRDFSFELLQAASGFGESILVQTLTQLVEREILFQRGVPPRAHYSFKHALIQEAAYQSLLRAARRQYHCRAAQALVSQFVTVAERQPELIAEHFFLGGEIESAVTYWRTAGDRARARFANVEAVANFKKALAQLANLPPSPDSARRELELLNAIGTSLTAVAGYAAPEAEHIFERARGLCQTVGDTPQLYPTLRGLQSYYQVRGPLSSAREICEQLLRLARKSGEPSLLVEAQRALGWCLFCLGEMQAGKNALSEALARYRVEASYQNILTYGADAGVLGHVNLGWAEWCLGDADRAVQLSERAMQLAETVRHPLSTAYALCMSAAIQQGVDRPDAVEQLARKTLAIAAEHRFSYWNAWGSILLGWAVARKGALADGIMLLNEGLVAYRGTGAELFRPYALTLLADILGRADRPKEGLACIDEAIEQGASNNVRFFEAESIRIRAQLLAQNEGDLQAARDALKMAIACAEAQGARMFEVRARNDLARLEATGLVGQASSA